MKRTPQPFLDHWARVRDWKIQRGIAIPPYYPMSEAPNRSVRDWLMKSGYVTCDFVIYDCEYGSREREAREFLRPLGKWKPVSFAFLSRDRARHLRVWGFVNHTDTEPVRDSVEFMFMNGVISMIGDDIELLPEEI